MFIIASDDSCRYTHALGGRDEDELSEAPTMSRGRGGLQRCLGSSGNLDFVSMPRFAIQPLTSLDER